MKKTIIIMACAAATLTGCKQADESGTMNEPSGAERSGDTNGQSSGSQYGTGQSDSGTQSTNNSSGSGTSGKP